MWREQPPPPGQPERRRRRATGLAGDTEHMIMTLSKSKGTCEAWVHTLQQIRNPEEALEQWLRA